MASTKQLFLALLLLVVGIATGQEEVAEERSIDDAPETNNELSPAEEIMRAALLAGYNLTLDIVNKASNKTDEEVKEMMPAPVAEKFISHRRRDGMDLIREQMIGMIFTGAPLPLGSNINRRPNRPNRVRNNFRPNKNQQGFHVDFNPQGESSIQSTRKVVAPNTILKPMPFVPGPTQVQFPSHMSGPRPSGPVHHPNHRPEHHRPPPPQRPPQHDIRRPPPPQQRPLRPQPPQQHDNQRFQRHPHGGDFGGINDNFGNTIGPDFGPVTFEDFGGFDNDFDFKHPNPPAPKPAPPKAPSRPSRPSHPSRPSRPSPSRPSHSSRPATSFTTNSGGFGGFSSNEGSCVKYTDDICLDTNSYPHEAILTSLAGDPARTDTMIAEVRSQSADDLVDGLSATQESKYNYDHYYGSENRRAGNEVKDARDFAEDGGYLCPSEVKYARPKRARNSKGSWKYIVNMEKYSQTIRMEKCMKPGGTCSYVSHHYQAQCNQVYNYHRLLSWEKNRGLHMDIFKVPSCCSCHIQGYAYVFPPLNRQTPAGSEVVEHTVPSPDVNDVSPKQTEHGGNYGSSRNPSHPRRRAPDTQTQRGEDRGGYSDSDGINRSSGPNAEDRKVNYGYHPIIDFFSPYRLKAH